MDCCGVNGASEDFRQNHRDVPWSCCFSPREGDEEKKKCEKGCHHPMIHRTQSILLYVFLLALGSVILKVSWWSNNERNMDGKLTIFGRIEFVKTSVSRSYWRCSVVKLIHCIMTISRWNLMIGYLISFSNVLGMYRFVSMVLCKVYLRSNQEKKKRYNGASFVDDGFVFASFKQYR